MFKLLISSLQELNISPGFLRLFDYITFRALMAMVTGLLFNLLFGHKLVVFLYRKKLRDASGDLQAINVYSKRGTPTAGGVLIILSTLVSLFWWADFVNPFMPVLIIGFLYLGLVGFIDDFQKSRFKSSLSGLSQVAKTVLLLLFVVPFAGYFLSNLNPLPSSMRTLIYIPFYKHPVVDLGPVAFFLFTLFALFAIINAVNMADGLDGLLSGLSMVTIGVYGVFAYIIGNAVLSRHYLFPYFEGLAEISVFGAALVGGILGFMWYNFFPAEVFMGDTGSLAIGGAIAMMTFFCKQEILFLIVGGVFVFEILTSLLQDKLANWSKLGRRILHRAPFHHSLIHKGIAEPKAVFRLLIAAVVLAVIGLLSIKIR